MMNIITASKVLIRQSVKRGTPLRGLVMLPRQTFSNGEKSSSGLFSRRLKDIRQQIKEADNAAQKDSGSRVPHASANDYDSFYGTADSKSSLGDIKQDLMRPELIYNLDMDGVLGAMKRVRSENLPKQSNDFYHACLDRID
jgi:hypothetical protein